MTENSVPDWIHLMPTGTFSGIDGRGPYKLDNPAMVIATSMLPGRLPVDENHSIDLAAPKGGPSPAAGWIVRMQLRNDGIWGNVEWTPLGRKFLDDKAYRGISPAFVFDGNTRQVVSISRAALTNSPNLPQLVMLNSNEAVCHSALPQRGQQRTLAAYQPTAEERRTYELMGIDVNRVIEMKSREGAAVMTYGLSSVEQDVCRGMNISLMAFSEQKAATESGEETYGLPPEERAICRRLNVSFKDYAENKGKGEMDPLVMKLPPEARNLWATTKMGLSEFALWYYKSRDPAGGGAFFKA